MEKKAKSSLTRKSLGEPGPCDQVLQMQNQERIEHPLMKTLTSGFPFFLSNQAQYVLSNLTCWLSSVSFYKEISHMANSNFPSI